MNIIHQEYSILYTLINIENRKKKGCSCMKNYIAYLSISVRNVFDKPLNTFKFSNNNIVERICVPEPSYMGF